MFGLEFDSGLVATIISAIITILVVFGAWTRVEKVLSALKEMADVIAYLPKMLADKKVTEEEIKELEKEFKEAVEAVKNITKK